jgi:asparagine synthase (glutamine-hydrolysing)
LLNPKTNTIQLHRDAFGIKPLMLRRVAGNAYFASEVAPLAQVSNKVRISRGSISQYLAYGRPLAGTFFSDVIMLPRGSITDLHRGQCEVHRHRYASMPAESIAAATPHDLRMHVKRAIKNTTISDRRLGIAASGGLDSTIVCAELSALGFEDLDVVSISAENSLDGIQSLAELELPGESWRSWRLHACRFGALEFPRYLARSVKVLGFPTRMSSVPLYLKLAEQAANAGITVLMLGEGADEVFCGYSDYLPMKHSASASRYIDRRVDSSTLSCLLHKSAIQQAELAKDEYLKCLTGDDEWSKLRSLDVEHSLEPLLHRADHLLMQYSIEGRTPFLHGALPSIGYKSSPEDLLRNRTTKFSLRQAYSNLLSSKVLEETKRHFRAPLTAWFTGPLLSWVLSEFHRGAPMLETLGVRREGLAIVLAGVKRGNERSCNIAYSLVTLLAWLDWLVQDDLLDDPDLIAAYQEPVRFV